MATGSQNMTTYLAKGLEKVLTTSAINTDNLLYINTTDTNITADMLGATTSIAITRANITGAYTTGHMVWLNAANIGTPFQLVVHDSSDLYLYKRYKNSGTWTEWTKMRAGTADTWTTARTLTIGNTGKSVDGSANVSWSKDEILGASTDAYFLRGDKVWSNTLNSVLLLPKGLKTGARVNDSGSGVAIDTDGGIEIFHTTTPFIDFHYQASTADYSVRLICDSATNLTCIGTFTAKGNITANGGYLYSTLNGNTIQIGSQNGSYGHFTNSKDIPFWFNKVIQSDGGFTIYNTGANNWRNGYFQVNKSDGGDCYIEICRAANADWRILNSSGNLYFQSNWTSAKGSYFTVLQLDYNTGRAHFKEYVYASYFNASCGVETPADGSYWLFANSDGFFRKSSRANIAAKIDLEHKWVRIGGDTMTGDLLFSNSGTTTRQIRGIVGDNDYWRIAGGATAANAGWMEIATADDGNEPIYVRQYTGVFSTLTRTLTLLDASGNTVIPGEISIGSRQATSGPSSLTYANRITIVPYYHTGGPWYIKSADNSSNAYLALYYGSSELIRIMNEGTFQASLKCSITGNAATATKLSNTPNNTTTFLRGDNTWTSTINNTIICIPSTSNMAASNMAFNGGIQVRENGAVQTGQSAIEYGPRISFHWGGRVAKSITLHSNGTFYFRDQNGTTRSTIDANVVGALTGNATTATTASYANALNNNGGRRASANYMWGDGRIRYMLATSSMTTAKPSSDGHIIHFSWDNTGGYDAQLAISNSGAQIEYRGGLGGGSGNSQNWSAWKKLLDSSNYTSYTVTKTGSGASGSWGISVTGSSASCTGNAATASKITNIGTGDAASSSNTWRRAWFCYDDNTTGRPAYTDKYAFQSSTGTLKVGRISCWPADGSNSYNEGIRIHSSSGNWATLMLLASGSDSDTGVNTNDWGIYNNNGTLYINKGTSGGAGNPRVYANANGWYFTKAYGAVWNDFAEYRKVFIQEPGYAIAPSGTRTTKRLEAGARITSDTYGYAIGYMEDKEDLMPVAIAGRVLAYPLHDKSYYEVGDAVCAAEGGKIDKMTREEIMMYPDRILGIVNEIPDYDIWEPSREGGGREPIHTNGRIWIDIR